MTELLFSYGTLQKEKVQLDLFGRKLTGTKDSLPGYKLSSIEITDGSFLSKGENKLQKTVTISNDNKDIINGTAFEITAEELTLADQYEPDNYKRVLVILGSGRQAWIYEAK